MKLGLICGYSGAQVKLPMELAHAAEDLGYDSLWTAEAWGADAVTTATWLLANTTRIRVGTAVVQMAARTPSITAMTAMTLDQLSGGRFLLGIGPSGPQVIEGWYGQPYGKPLTRTREYIDICRQIFRREAPLMHKGEHYQIPYNGPGAMGLGKPLKSILHGNPNIPIYMGVATEKGIGTAAEVADGCFMIWANPDRTAMFQPTLKDGFAKAGGGKGMHNFDFAPFVRMAMGPDLQACRDKLKHNFALYVGGMGAREKNFYNDYTRRLGYADAAAIIQDLYLAGRKEEAAAAVPDEYVDECCLVGPREHIREQLSRWKAASQRGEIGSMIVGASTREELEVVAEVML